MVEYQRRIIKAEIDAAIADVCELKENTPYSIEIECLHCGYQAVLITRCEFMCTECYETIHEEDVY
jgi:hypothetical protein